MACERAWTRETFSWFHILAVNANNDKEVLPGIMLSFLLNPSPTGAAGRPSIPKEHNESLYDTVVLPSATDFTKRSPAEASQKHDRQKALPSVRASPDEQASPDSTRQQHENPTKKQPNESDTGETISYRGQQWVYKGSQWAEEGILCLKLQTAGSDAEPISVREAEV